MTPSHTDAYIYDAVRSPRGRGKSDGSLHEVTALRLSAEVLNALRDRTGLPTEQVEDVIWGCVTPVAEQGGDIARSGRALCRLGRAHAGAADQPLLRQRAGSGEPGRQPDPGRGRATSTWRAASR